MDRCEAFWEWDKKFKNSMCSELSNLRWNNYDEIDRQESLAKKTVSDYLKIKVENISIMCGGFDAIYNFMLSQQNNIFHIPKDSFFGYKAIANKLNIPVVEKSNNDLFESSFHKIVCTPDTTSGIRIEDDVIMDLCKKDNPVLIDKTYFYFHEHPKDNKIKILNNVVTNISLSKSFSMAAMRASILVGDSDLINTIERVKKPFHVPILTSIAIRKFFDEEWIDYFRKKSIELECIRLKKESLLVDLEYKNPNANFLCIQKRKNIPAEIKEHSRDMGKFYRLTLKDSYE